MRKTSLVLAIMVMLMGVSVHAQKRTAQGGIAVQGESVIIKDDNGGGFMSLDPAAGVYKGSFCEAGVELSGTGQVKIDGCNVYFSDLQTGYRIFATVNMCDRTAKCAFEIFDSPRMGLGIQPILETWTDSDLQDSTPDCAAPKTD